MKGICLLFASLCSAQTAVQLHGQLRVQGNRIVDKNNQVTQFRGMALYWSQWKPAFYNARCVQWLKNDWRVDIVRPSMAIRSGGYMSGPSAAAAEKNKIKTVVQAAIDQGLYVVIDWHETDNGNDHLDSAKSFFADMARTYGQYPNVIYELWNEPLNTHPWATVIKPYHEAVISTIRAIDPDNLILCSSKSWAQDVDEASRSPITTSTNIIYTLHFYAATHKQSLRDKADTALKNGLALMVTEGGLSSASGDGTIDTSEMRRWVNFMDQRGISWMNWSIADLTETSAALTPGASGNGNWTASQLSGSGTWVRNEIRAKNPVPTPIFRAGEPVLKAKQGRLSVEDALFDLNGRDLTGIFSSQRPRKNRIPVNSIQVKKAF